MGALPTNYCNISDKLIDENIDYCDKNKKCNDLGIKLRDLKSSISKCAQSVDEIRKFAKEYDFDDETPGNGFHSFVQFFDAALKKSGKVCKKLTLNREKLFFSVKTYEKYEI